MLMFSPAPSPASARAKESLVVVLLSAIDERRNDRRRRGVKRVEDDARDQACIHIDFLGDARAWMNDPHVTRMPIQARDQVPDP